MDGMNSNAVEIEIDRSKACPHLLRLFWKSNRNNPQLEYKSVAHGKFPANEIQIYTWPDATLREISDLLKSTVAIARQRHVTLSFDLVYPDRNGVHVIRHVSLNHFLPSSLPLCTANLDNRSPERLDIFL
jgi:histone deacetylase complex subunit SAP18